MGFPHGGEHWVGSPWRSGHKLYLAMHNMLDLTHSVPCGWEYQYKSESHQGEFVDVTTKLFEAIQMPLMRAMAETQEGHDWLSQIKVDQLVKSSTGSPQ